MGTKPSRHTQGFRGAGNLALLKNLANDCRECLSCPIVRINDALQNKEGPRCLDSIEPADGKAAGEKVPSLELAGFVEYTDLSDSGDETSYAGEIRWNISDIFTIGAGYSTADDADTIYGGVRLYWGKKW